MTNRDLHDALDRREGLQADLAALLADLVARTPAGTLPEPQAAAAAVEEARHLVVELDALQARLRVAGGA